MIISQAFAEEVQKYQHVNVRRECINMNRAVCFLRPGIKQAVCGMEPPDGMRTTVSSPSFLPSERAPFRKRIPASNGCTNGLDTRRQRASEGVQME